jgi:hypothetical protein
MITRLAEFALELESRRSKSFADYTWRTPPFHPLSTLDPPRSADPLSDPFPPFPFPPTKASHIFSLPQHDTGTTFWLR